MVSFVREYRVLERIAARPQVDTQSSDRGGMGDPARARHQCDGGDAHHHARPHRSPQAHRTACGRDADRDPVEVVVVRACVALRLPARR
jgi:hypothetical protein